MKTLRVITINLFIFVSIGMFSHFSWASCTFQIGTRTVNYTAPILKTQFTVGRDVPLGTIIYRQIANTSEDSLIYCSGSGNLTTKRYVTNNTKIKANWTGQPFPNAVYESGVPGIGVAYAWRKVPLPYAGTYPFTDTYFSYKTILDFEIYFIKIGPVSPGVINLSSFPTASLEVDWGTADKLVINNVNFSGSMQFISQTCTTPDVNVDLGVNSIEPLVAGTQTETTRTGFTLRFTDCPIMYGIGASGDSDTPYWTPQDGTVRYNDIQNNMKIMFMPKNGVLDSDAMIAKLDPVQPGNAPAAEGIGIALYYGYGKRYKFDGNFLDGFTFHIGQAPSGIIIPLEASYTFDATKPKTAIKPGYGNTAIEFTIQYN